MFDVKLDTVVTQLEATAMLSVFNEPKLGNRAVLTTHCSNDETYEDSTVVMLLTVDELDALAKAVDRAREGLAAAERGGIVGLATWAERNAK